MTSINTNMAAMTALETLRNINTNLNKVNDQISTGKKINSARDNAAVWSIASTMEADVASFKTITDSLNLGAATVGVARSASEQIAELLKEMKALVTSAQEENVDRTKIQRDVVALRDQISSIVKAASFNGLNLLQAGDAVSLLSSLNRSSTGTVTSDKISVERNDLTQTAGTVTGGLTSSDAGAVANDGTTFGGSATATASAGTPTTPTAGTIDLTVDTGPLVLTDGGTADYTVTVGTTTVTVNFTDATLGNAADNTIAQEDVLDAIVSALDAEGVPAGVTYARAGTGGAATLTISNTSIDDLTVTVESELDSAGMSDDDAGHIQVGTTSTADISTDTLAAATPAFSTPGTAELTFQTGTVSEGSLYKLTIGSDTVEYRARAGDTSVTVVEKLVARASSILPDDVTFSTSGGGNVISISNATAASVGVTVTSQAGAAGGALEDLANIDVTTNLAASSALGDVEDMLAVVIDAAAQFGSAQKRIDIQNDFITSLVDSLKLGVSALVDADLEEASAKITALQVQQQLGLQSLAIANAAPQSILALFR